LPSCESRATLCESLSTTSSEFGSRLKTNMRHSISLLLLNKWWIGFTPTTERHERQFVRVSSLLRITSHLANGVKHFEAKAKHHRSVADVEKSRYVEAGYVEDGYFEDPLIVHLTADEQKLLAKAVSKSLPSHNRSTSIGKTMHGRHNPAVNRTCAKSAQAGYFYVYASR